MATGDDVFVWEENTGELLGKAKVPKVLAQEEVHSSNRAHSTNKIPGQRNVNIRGNNGQLQRILLGHTAVVMSVQFNPRCTRVATGSLDKSVRIFELSTGNLIQKLDHSSGVMEVAFSPCGLHLAAIADRCLWIWQDQEVRREHHLAFACGRHPLLGQDSPVNMLPVELVDKILLGNV